MAERSGLGTGMEGYLGNLFNHGAVLVNIFGWGVGGDDNPFRKIAEGPSALEAYKKFLQGEPLNETRLDVPAAPSAGLADKIHRVQALLPGWVQRNGPARVKDDLEKLERAIREKRFDEVTEAADAILNTIER